MPSSWNRRMRNLRVRYAEQSIQNLELRLALERLVYLKDGPRDEPNGRAHARFTEITEPFAWARARDVLGLPQPDSDEPVQALSEVVFTATGEMTLQPPVKSPPMTWEEHRKFHEPVYQSKTGDTHLHGHSWKLPKSVSPPADAPKGCICEYLSWPDYLDGLPQRQHSPKCPVHAEQNA